MVGFLEASGAATKRELAFEMLLLYFEVTRLPFL